MPTATFRFYGLLNDFLPVRRRQVPFGHTVGGRASVKDVIESLGVPHPEIGLLLANGLSVDFSYLIRDADYLSVYPAFSHFDVSAVSLVQPGPFAPFRFVLDVHLGTLATYLRMLGFDTLYQNNYSDENLAHISYTNTRMLLTRDRGLLMRSLVTHGYFIRNTNPRKQLIEVVQRFDLAGEIRSLQRCLACNGALASVRQEAILDQLPPRVREGQEQFWQCQQCQRVYWPGTHYQRMQEFVDEIRKQVS